MNGHGTATGTQSPASPYRKDSAEGVPKRKDSVGNYIVPAAARRESKTDSIGPLVEKRRASICAEPPPPSGRRASVDIFEGMPAVGMGRRASISPNAPRLEAPTIRQDHTEHGLCIYLECRITSESEPIATWYHLDERVKTDDRHKHSVKKVADVWVACLEMRDVKMKDAGKYTIKVQNGAGEQFATIFSFVEKNTRKSSQGDVKHPESHHKLEISH